MGRWCGAQSLVFITDSKPFPFQVKNDYKSEPPRPAAPAKWDLNDPKVQEFLDIRPGPGGMQSC